MIKPLDNGTCGRGGNADVIPAELVMVEASESSSSDNVQHVAVKKLRPDSDTDHPRILAVGCNRPLSSAFFLLGGFDTPLAMQLLAHEVSLVNDLSHKNIVKVVGFVEDRKDGTAWIILPWEKSGNLREFVASAAWELTERVALVGRIQDPSVRWFADSSIGI